MVQDILYYVQHDHFNGLAPSSRRHCLGSAKGWAAQCYFDLYWAINEDEDIAPIIAKYEELF
jgi:hypothetical protein